MPYAEQFLPSRSKKRTSRGATVAVRKSRGQSAAPRVAASPTTPTSTPTRSSSYKPSKAATRKVRQATRARQRLIRKAIRSEPRVAERKVEKRVQRVLERSDYKRRPDIEIGGKRERPDTRRTTVINRATAKQVLSAKPEERKRAVRKLAHATIQTPKAPKRVEIKKRPQGKGVAVEVEPRRTKQEKQERKEVITKLRKAAKRSQGGLAKKLNRPFGPSETITPRQAAIVAESEGLPGRTYAKAIAPGESGLRPGVPNPDDATPSLFQMTPSVQSAETKAKWDRIAAKFPGGYSNPIVAAKQARVLAKGKADEGVSNYYGFNPSAPQGHLPGGQKAARRKLYGKPKPIPKKLKREAKEVLGRAKTKEVIKKAKAPKASGPKPVPLKELKKHIQFTEPKSEVRSEQGAPARTSLTGMNASMQRALVKLSKISGKPVRINEGYRTTKRANEFPSGTGSQHHQGNAADVENWRDYTADQLRKAGLNNTSVAGEPWHLQTNVLSSGGAVIAGSGGFTSPAAAPGSSGASTAVAGSSRKRKAKKLDGRARSRLIRKLIAETPTVAKRGTGYTRTTESLEDYVANLTATLDL